MARRHAASRRRRQVHLRGGAAQVPCADQGLDGAARWPASRPRTTGPSIFRFKQPYAPLLYQLDATEAPIVAKHVYQGTDPQTNPANGSPVGTGPFKFVAYKKGAEIRLARNAAYFKRGAAVPRRARDARHPGPVGTQVLALESGEVDFLWGCPALSRAACRRMPAFAWGRPSYHPGGSNCIMTVSFNLDRPISQRRCGSGGPSRSRSIAQAFLRQVLFGEGKVATAPDLERDPVGSRRRA